MRKLNVDKKTGFVVNDIYKPIVIRDYRGILFYTTEPLLPKVKEFNLPPGTYFVDSGYFSPKTFPVYYPKIKMPFPQRFYKSPYDFKTSFGNNPNKATINWVNKTILFDNSLKECTIPELEFILWHEFGHAYYKDEKAADLYAANKMLDRGFNPSQVGIAPDTLSDKQDARKMNVLKNLFKYVI
jgi:hypothetical protein